MKNVRKKCIVFDDKKESKTMNAKTAKNCLKYFIHLKTYELTYITVKCYNYA